MRVLQQTPTASSGIGRVLDDTSDTSIQPAPKQNFFQKLFQKKLTPDPTKDTAFDAGNKKGLGSLFPSEKGLGQDIAYGKNNKQYQDALSSHNTTVNNLQTAIDKNTTAGQDTSHYKELLSQLQNEKPTPEDFGAVKPSAEKVAGDVVGTGVDVASAFIAPGAGEVAVDAAEKGLVKKGIATGAKVGAGYGAAQGVASGLQQEKSAGGVAKEGVIGGVVGGVTGTAVGGAGAKVSKMFSPKTDEVLQKEALDVLTPKLTASEKETAAAAGRTKTTGGIFKKIEVVPDKKTEEAAKVVSGIVDSKKSYSENIKAVRGALSQKAEALKTAIGDANHPYTFKELNSRLANVDKPISIKSDSVLSKQFDLVRSAFMDIAKKNGGDISNLLDSRKEFDALVEKEFPNLYDRENAPMRNAITSMRTAVNDFIEENVPDSVAFKQSLKDQSLMYHAIDNMATNAKDEIGTNAIARLTKKYPKTATAVGTAATLLGAEKLGIGKFFK